MIWYSFLDKRGDYIKKLVNWCLLNNKNIIINNVVLCEYIENKYLIYNENEFTNRVDLKNEIFIRNNKEYEIKYDFKNNYVNIVLLKENKYFEDTFKGNIIKKDNKIHIIYTYSDEEKEIIIQIL